MIYWSKQLYGCPSHTLGLFDYQSRTHRGLFEKRSGISFLYGIYMAWSILRHLHGLSVVSVQDCKEKSPTVIAVQQFAFSYSVHRRMPKCMYLDVPCVYVLKVFARKDTMRLWVVDFYKLLNRLCLDYSLYRLLAIFCGFNSVRHRLVVLV